MAEDSHSPDSGHAAPSLESLTAQGLGRVDPITRALVPAIHPSTTYERDPDVAELLLQDLDKKAEEDGGDGPGKREADGPGRKRETDGPGGK